MEALDYEGVIEARRKYQREYHKKWRDENKDKVKAINDRFYSKKAKKKKTTNIVEMEECNMASNRNENKCRNITSKDGSFSPHINKTTTSRLTTYCHHTDQNRTKFVEWCVNYALDHLEKEFYMGKSKEELIEMLLRK